MAIRIRYLLLVVVFFLVGIAIGMLVTPAVQSSGIKVVNDRDYTAEVVYEIENADYSVHVSVYSLDYYLKYPHSDANKIMKALGDAHDRGLDVRIIVDEYPKSADGMAYLIERGVSIKYDGNAQSTHTKLAIIDSDTVFVGSTNWRYYSLEKNHEANVVLYSFEIAQEFEEYFEEIWNAT